MLNLLSIKISRGVYAERSVVLEMTKKGIATQPLDGEGTILTFCGTVNYN